MPPYNRYLGLVLTIGIVFALHFLVFNPSAPNLRLILPSGTRPSNDHDVTPGFRPGGGPPQAVSLGSKPTTTQHPLETLNDDFLSPDIEFDERGIMAYDPELHDKHPVELLVERGKRMAESIEARIAKVDTVAAAVDDYEQAYGMPPPRGFDSW